MSQETTLGARLSGQAFVNSLRSWVQEQARRIESATDGSAWARRQVATIQEFDRYLSTTGPENQQLVALSLLSGLQPGGRGEFKPTDKQVQLIARLGQYEGSPPPGTTLEEMVVAAALDAGEAVRAREMEVRRAEDEADVLRKDLEIERENHAISDTAAIDIERQRDTALADVADLTEQVETLRQMLGGGEPATPKPKRFRKERRTRVEGHTGVYEAANGDYEINYQEGGKTRWKVIGPDLQAAIDERARLAGAVAA